jgi:hypothetical protein
MIKKSELQSQYTGFKGFITPLTHEFKQNCRPNRTMKHMDKRILFNVYASTATTFNKQQRYRKQKNINKIQHVTKRITYFKEYFPVKNSQFKEF